MGQNLPRLSTIPSVAVMATGLVLATPAALSLDAVTPPDETLSATSPSNRIGGDGERPLVSSPGFTVLTDIRSARIALVNRNLTEAAQLLDDALKRLRLTLKVPAEGGLAAKAETWVRVDGQVLVSNETTHPRTDTVPADAASSTIAVAHSNGDGAQPENAQNSSGFQVNFTEILMPARATLVEVLKARQMMAAHKFYEANATLDRVESQLKVRNTPLTAGKVVHRPEMGTP